VSEYNPDSVSPPGSTLRDIITERGLNQYHFFTLTGLSELDFQKLLRGTLPIKTRLAIRLGLLTDTEPHFWLKREFNYRNSIKDKEDEQIPTR
jgi:HTH-type transcriptional regulator/antitoxin HigA